MNVREAVLTVDETQTTSFLEQGPSLVERAARTAATAAADADGVDRDARFPHKAFEVAREQKLLGVMIPAEFGGFGASIHDVTDVCYALGRACASTAMIYAMHQTKVACLVRHGRGSAWHRSAAAPVARRADAARLLDDRRSERRRRPQQRRRRRAAEGAHCAEQATPP